jgi:phosphatidate cytidylyltransferase
VYNLFNKELSYRIFSVIIFIPLVILPLIFSNYISILVYLLFASIILNEISNMKATAGSVYILNLYSIITSLSFFLFLFLLITNFSQAFLISVIFIIWLFDTFSYLGGKLIGGIKLMPKISSGKTISGLISGILFTLFLSEIFFNLFLINMKLSIFYVLFIIILSFTGDTLVSLLKRYAAIKDSGKIMPGHGGLLDRFDSFIMVFFVLGILGLII